MEMAGVATVYHLDGTVAFSGLIALDNKMIGIEVQDNFDVVDFKDGGGEVLGATAFNRRQEATFTIIPHAPSGTNTVVGARNNVVMPTALGLVTVAGFGTAPNNIKPFVGNWNYMGGGSITKDGDGNPIRITLPCRRIGAPANATALTPVGS